MYFLVFPPSLPDWWTSGLDTLQIDIQNRQRCWPGPPLPRLASFNQLSSQQGQATCITSRQEIQIEGPTITISLMWRRKQEIFCIEFLLSGWGVLAACFTALTVSSLGFAASSRPPSPRSCIVRCGVHAFDRKSPTDHWAGHKLTTHST